MPAPTADVNMNHTDQARRLGGALLGGTRDANSLVVSNRVALPSKRAKWWQRERPGNGEGARLLSRTLSTDEPGTEEQLVMEGEALRIKARLAKSNVTGRALYPAVQCFPRLYPCAVLVQVANLLNSPAASTWSSDVMELVLRTMLFLSKLTYSPPDQLRSTLLAWGLQSFEHITGEPSEPSILVAYVADAGQLHVFVAVRGTQTAQDMVTDARVSKGKYNSGGVHRGFLDYFLKGAKAFELIARRVAGTVPERLAFYVTGHSLGGGVALLLAAKAREYTHRVHLVTFGAPRVGDERFCESFFRDDRVLATHLRVYNSHDVVPEVPLQSSGYLHVDEYARKVRSPYAAIYRSLDVKPYRWVHKQDFSSGVAYLLSLHSWYAFNPHVTWI